MFRGRESWNLRDTHMAETLNAPLVTEHIAFVRGGGPLTRSPRLEAGHLLPVPRTRDAQRTWPPELRPARG